MVEERRHLRDSKFWEGSSPSESAIDVFRRRFTSSHDFPDAPSVGCQCHVEMAKLRRSIDRMELVVAMCSWVSFFLGVVIGLFIMIFS